MPVSAATTTPADQSRPVLDSPAKDDIEGQYTANTASIQSSDIRSDLDQRVQINPRDNVTLTPGTNYTISVVTGVEAGGLSHKPSVSNPALRIRVSSDSSSNPQITGIASPKSSYDVQRDSIETDQFILLADEFTPGSIHRTMVRLHIPKSAEQVTVSANVGRGDSYDTDSNSKAIQKYTVTKPDDRWAEMARLAESRSTTAGDLSDNYDSIFNDRSVESIVDRGMDQTFVQTSLFVKDIYNLQLSGGIRTKLSGAKSAVTQFSEYHDSYRSEAEFDGPWVGPIISAQNKMLSDGKQQIQRNRVDNAGETKYILEEVSTLAKEEQKAWEANNRQRAIKKLKKQYELLTYSDSTEEYINDEEGVIDDGARFNLPTEAREQRVASNYDRNSRVRSSLLFNGIIEYSEQRAATIENIALPTALNPQPNIQLTNRKHVEEKLNSTGSFEAVFEVSNTGNGGVTSREAYASIIATEDTLSIEKVEQITDRSDSELPNIQTTSEEKVYTRGGNQERISGTLLDINEQYEPGETNVYRVTLNRNAPITDKAALTYRTAFQPLIHTANNDDAFTRYPTRETPNSQRGRQGWFVKEVSGVASQPTFDIDISSTNEPIEAGESLHITATVRNQGTTSSTQTIKLNVTEIGSDTKHVSLAGSETADVTFTIPTHTEDHGTYTITPETGGDSTTETASVVINKPDDDNTSPRDFEVRRVIPEKLTVQEGNPLSLSATIANSGSIDDTQVVEFSADGRTLATKRVSVAAGFAKTISFSDIDTSSLTPGNYRYNLSTSTDSIEGNLSINPADDGTDEHTPSLSETTVRLNGSIINVRTDGAEYINISNLPQNIDISDVSENGSYYSSRNIIVYKNTDNGLPTEVQFKLDPNNDEYQAGENSLSFSLSDRILSDQKSVTLSIISNNKKNNNSNDSSKFVDVDTDTLAGSGTSEDPYILTNISELQAIEDDPDASYTLANDIDASSTAEWNNGSGFAPIGSFDGTLDGSGYSIKSLTINRSSQTNVGLFSGIQGVTKNISIIDGKIRGDVNTGALAGSNSGTIKSSYTIGNISGNEDTGGLVGRNHGKIVSSYTKGSINASSEDAGGIASVNEGSITRSFSTSVVRADGAGGLVGYNSRYGGTIESSYSIGKVSGSNIGGLVGMNGGTIKSSYAAAVLAGSPSGGIVASEGRAYDIVVANSYWDTDRAEQSISAGDGRELTTSQMTGKAAQTNMTGLDFNTVWETQQDGYPTLISQPSDNDDKTENSPPRGRFEYSPSAPMTTENVTFNASNSVDPDGTISSYEWDFDNDGTVDQTGETVTYSFGSAGEYAPTLTVTDDDGKTNTTTKLIPVNSTSGVNIRDIKLDGKSVVTNRSTHKLRFTVENLSPDGTPDKFTITMPDSVNVEDVAIVESGNLSPENPTAENPITFSVNPIQTTQVEMEVDLTLSSSSE